MFLLKKYVARLFFPLPLSLEFLLLGLALLWFTRRQRTGKILVTVGTLLLCLFGSGLVADFVLRPLESDYAPLLAPEKTLGGRAELVKWILVLAAGYAPDEDVPVTSRFTGGSLTRLAEGIRIQRHLPGSKLLLSLDPHGNAKDLQELAGILGVDARDMAIHPIALDTRSEATYFREVIGDAPFVLVTTASHMRRAVVLFHAQGMDPIPAPTGHHAVNGPSYDYWIPSCNSLGKAEIVFYEHLGSVWSKLSR